MVIRRRGAEQRLHRVADGDCLLPSAKNCGPKVWFSSARMGHRDWMGAKSILTRKMASLSRTFGLIFRASPTPAENASDTLRRNPKRCSRESSKRLQMKVIPCWTRFVVAALRFQPLNRWGGVGLG